MQLMAGYLTLGAVDAGPLPAVLFYLFAAIVLGSAVGVALARNIVRAAAALLFTLAGMAGFYFLLNAEFLAAVQLVVYVGGTLILVIFGVMLTSKNPNVHYEPKAGEVVWAVLTGLVIAVGMTGLVVRVWGNAGALNQGSATMNDLGKTLVDPQGYLAPFELVSVVLLAVMIGAAYLAKATKTK